ncbi:MAG: hypothetical protein Q7R47_06535 [Candidatus Diapherotrites archaeon]|nr:hypothetical protein [Candidatus Diapherotrites archaeon]
MDPSTRSATKTDAPAARARETVRSVDPESMTTISSSSGCLTPSS